MSISGITAVYVTVLKRTGWIGHAQSRQAESSQIQPSPKEKPAHSSRRKIEHSKIHSTEPLESEDVTGNAEKEEHQPYREAELNKKAALKQKLAQTLIEAQKSSEAYEIPRRCTHHFGYHYSLKKNEAISDECYSCSKLIQCFQKPKKIGA